MYAYNRFCFHFHSDELTRVHTSTSTQANSTPTNPNQTPSALISPPPQLHRYICLEKGAALPCANIYAIQDCNDVERCVFYEDIYKCWDKEQKLQCDELNYYGEASCTKHDCTSTRLYAMARVSSKKGRERGRERGGGRFFVFWGAVVLTCCRFLKANGYQPTKKAGLVTTGSAWLKAR